MLYDGNVTRDIEFLGEGQKYDVGINNEGVFRNVTYRGETSVRGKPIMLFKDENDRELAVNVSYHTFTMECKEADNGDR
jgi:hypothetical protein